MIVCVSLGVFVCFFLFSIFVPKCILHNHLHNHHVSLFDDQVADLENNKGVAYFIVLTILYLICIIVIAALYGFAVCYGGGCRRFPVRYATQEAHHKEIPGDAMLLSCSVYTRSAFHNKGNI